MVEAIGTFTGIRRGRGRLRKEKDLRAYSPGGVLTEGSPAQGKGRSHFRIDPCLGGGTAGAGKRSSDE